MPLRCSASAELYGWHMVKTSNKILQNLMVSHYPADVYLFKVNSENTGIMECVRLTKWYRVIFLCPSKVWSMLQYGLVGRVQNKNTTLYFHLLFCHFLVVLNNNICVFIICISFFDEVLNFRNRSLTNQKQELVVQNGMRTVPRLDSSPTDTSPRTIPRRTFSRTDNSPTGHFPEGHFPDWTFPH